MLLEAVAALKRGDVLLVAKRDRLGRDVIAVAMIERLVTKRGARVVSAAGEGTDSDDPSAMLMRRLIDSFAEYERLIISARTRAALDAKRRRGERVSGLVPFGYTLGRDGRTLEANAEEASVIETIRILREQGHSMADGCGTRVKRAATRGQDVVVNFRSQRRSGLSQTTSRSALWPTISGTACRHVCLKSARRGRAAQGSAASKRSGAPASVTILRTCSRAPWSAPCAVAAS